MKLYTKNQVKMIVARAKLYRGAVHDNFAFIMSEDEILDSETPIELPSNSICINCDESKSTHNVCIDCMIKIGKENIELPSDEEIFLESLNHKEPDDFNCGSQFVIGKILGDNK